MKFDVKEYHKTVSAIIDWFGSTPKIHAEKMMKWAKGEKLLRYYEDGEHCTQNYLDEVFPEIIDWFREKLAM